MDQAEQHRLLSDEVRRRRTEAVTYRRDHPWRSAGRAALALVVPGAIFSAFVSVSALVTDRELPAPADVLFPLVLFMGIMAAQLVWSMRKGVVLTEDAIAEEVRRRQAEWQKTTGPGWMWRAVRLGLGMGVLVAGAVTVMGPFLLSATTDLELGELLDGWALFVGLTFLWTIPFAFAVRLLVRWLHVRFRRQAGIEP